MNETITIKKENKERYRSSLARLSEILNPAPESRRFAEAARLLAGRMDRHRHKATRIRELAGEIDRNSRKLFS